MNKQSFIAILLPPEIEQRIDQWRAQFYPFGLYRVQAHLTIIPPFIPEYYKNELYTKIEQTVNSTPKIPISINSFDMFTHHSHTFFAKVEPSIELVNLQLAISHLMNTHRSIEIQDHAYKFTPHITIANRLGDEELNKIRQHFDGQSLDYKFEVDRLFLLTKVSDRYQIDSEWELDKP